MAAEADGAEPIAGLADKIWEQSMRNPSAETREDIVLKLGEKRELVELLTRFTPEGDRTAWNELAGGPLRRDRARTAGGGARFVGVEIWGVIDSESEHEHEHVGSFVPRAIEESGLIRSKTPADAHSEVAVLLDWPSFTLASRSTSWRSQDRVAPDAH